MAKPIRRYIALYLVLGSLWGIFAVYKGYELGYYKERNPYVYAPLTWVTNTAAWPIAIPLAIRLEMKE